MPIISTQKIIPQLELSFKSPKNITPEDIILFKKDITKTNPEVKIYSLKNVAITQDGVIFEKFKTFYQFLIWPSHKKHFNLKYILNTLLKNKREYLNSNQKVFVCFDYWSHGFAHWFIDFLPRLYIIKDDLKENTLLLPAKYKFPFMTEILEAFEINTIHYMHENTYLKCNNIIIPDRLSSSGDHNPEIQLKLRNHIWKFFENKIERKTYNKNIYISRAKAKYRKVINENEVVELLTKYEFKTIYMEDYSFHEQIAITHNAQNLVSLHGANLTNLIFMIPNSNILELRKKNDRENNYFFMLSSTFEINYYYQKCNYITHNQTGGNAFDVEVDIKLLEKNVLLMLKS